MNWQRIETAPKDTMASEGSHMKPTTKLKGGWYWRLVDRHDGHEWVKVWVEHECNKHEWDGPHGTGVCKLCGVKSPVQLRSQFA